jgi:transposase-like protein
MNEAKKKRGPYRRHSTEFKMQVVKEFVDGQPTVTAKQVASKYNIPTYYIYVWKNALTKSANQSSKEESE